MIILREGYYSLFGDILKGAIKGAAYEVDQKSGYNTPGPIFGTLVIDWCIDKSRYIGKNWTYTVDPDTLEVQANDGRSIISWDLDRKFEPLDTLGDWKKLTIKGVAKDGGELDATLVMKDGRKFNGRVDVEVKR